MFPASSALIFFCIAIADRSYFGCGCVLVSGDNTLVVGFEGCRGMSSVSSSSSSESSSSSSSATMSLLQQQLGLLESDISQKVGAKSSASSAASSAARRRRKRKRDKKKKKARSEIQQVESEDAKRKRTYAQNVAKITQDTDRDVSIQFVQKVRRECLSVYYTLVSQAVLRTTTFSRNRLLVLWDDVS